jgi:Zinc knuckle
MSNRVKGNMGYNLGNNNCVMTPEAVMAIVEAAKGLDTNQLDTTMMLCYNCGQFGHRLDRCRNARNFDLVPQTLKSQGWKPCEHCGQFEHLPEVCWSVPNNALLRPEYWKEQAQAQHGQNMSNGHNLNENMPDWSVGTMVIVTSTKMAICRLIMRR